MSLANKLIAITGAASGMGRATAHLLARRGALLSLCDINRTNLSSVCAELHASGIPKANLLSTVVDMRSTPSITSWLATTTAHFSRPLSGAANIAGIHPAQTAPITETTDEEFDNMMNVNSTGVFRCLRAQLADGIMDSPGSIVNISSIAGQIGIANDAAYTASKHAVNGLTRCASKEVGSRNIRVNAVAPGFIHTPMTQDIGLVGDQVREMASLGRGGRAEEIADMVAWLLSEESSYVTGCVMRCDGGSIE